MTLKSYQEIWIFYQSYICCSLPADCERGFSTMKRVKTPLRNRLGEATLDNLLTISIEGPEDFNFESVCDRWASLSKRRLDVSDGSKRQAYTLTLRACTKFSHMWCRDKSVCLDFPRLLMMFAQFLVDS